MTSSTAGDKGGGEQYYMKIIGFLHGSRIKLVALMDDSPENNILEMFKFEFDDSRKITAYTAMDVNGTTKSLAIKTFEDDTVQRLMVTVASRSIGQFAMKNKRPTTHSADESELLQIFNESGKIKFTGNIQWNEQRKWFVIKTVGGINVCTTHNNYKGIMSVQLDKELEKNTKTLLTSVSAFVFQIAFEMSRDLPSTSISTWQVDSNQATGKLTAGGITSFNQLLPANYVAIYLAGHNSPKNIIYYDVYDARNFNVYATIEVTPIKSYKGYAKIAIKDYVGATLCTAFHFRKHRIMALYNGNNFLYAYSREMQIFSLEHEPFLRLLDSKVGHDDLTSHPLKYIHPISKFIYAVEGGGKSGLRKIFNYGSKSNRPYTYDQLIGILILSMQRYLNVIPLKKPKPEVEYFYLNSKPAARSYIS